MQKIALILCPPVWALLPPPGLAYLAESLAAEGHAVSLYDLNVAVYNRLDKTYQRDWTVNTAYIRNSFYTDCCCLLPELLDALLDDLALHRVSYAGFSVFRSNRAFSLALAARIRQQLPAVRIIFGGPEVFSLRQEASQPADFIDHYVIGEGERPLAAILAGSGQRDYAFAQLTRLETFPRYRDFNLEQYSKQHSLPLVGSRGCLNHCRFCAERLLFKHYRFRPAEHIFTEIRYHFEQNRIRHFIFYDSLFNGCLPNLEELLDRIITAGLPVRWEAQICIRPEMSNRLLDKMLRSGCINLFIGLESGSDTVLKLMRKPFSAAAAAAFLGRLAASGLMYEISLITHYPGEGEQEFRETVNFLRAHRPVIRKIAQVNSFRAYPGTTVTHPPGYQAAAGRQKLSRLLEVFDQEGIPYTKSYIDNLI